MDFDELLNLRTPNSFPEETLYWEFAIYGLKQSSLVRAGNTGHYEHDEDGCNRFWRFDNFNKFKEAYIAAHEENIRRLKGNTETPLEISKMSSSTWCSHSRDNCG